MYLNFFVLFLTMINSSGLKLDIFPNELREKAE